MNVHIYGSLAHFQLRGVMLKPTPISLLVVAVWFVAVFSFSETVSAQRRIGRERDNLPLFQDQHAELHASFARELESIAESCDEKNLTEAAAFVRARAMPVDTRSLQINTLPSEVQPEIPQSLPAEERAWQVQLKHQESEYAKELYLLSRRSLGAGHVAFAYDLVREVAFHDPDHPAARKLLGYVRQGTSWVTPYAAQMLRRRYVWSDKFGWLPQDHLARYEEGERYVNRRWVSAAQEAEIRRDFSNAWEVRTDHYLIRTNHSLERGVSLGVQLEEFHRIFFQVFAGFFNSKEQLQQLFEGTGRRTVSTTKPFEIYYFRDRDEYNRHLRGKISQPIEITTGLYLSGDRTAYFFAASEAEAQQDVANTLFHEATHQLFSESRPSKYPVGMRANFWIIEGIACYMETFRQNGDEISLGDPNYVRFQAARYRLVNDRYFIPLAKFAGMGMQDFQSDPNISMNYSQASGFSHFLLHYDGGIYREALIEHLSDIYSQNPRVRDKPRGLDELTGVDYDELDRQYITYIRDLENVARPSTVIPENE